MVDPPAMPSAKKAKGTATPNATAWPPMTRHGWAKRPCGEMNNTNAVDPIAAISTARAPSVPENRSAVQSATMSATVAIPACST